MQQVAWIAVGGAVGSVGRYLVTLGAVRLLGPALPWGTLAVNVLGSLLLGFLMQWTGRSDALSPELRVLLTTGFLGAFTTFSTFSVETLRLFERGDPLAAAGNLLGNLALGLLAAWLGVWAARALTG